MIPPRKFGFELEVYNVVEKFALVKSLPGFKYASDSSIRGLDSMELVSPILMGEDGLIQAREAINQLKKYEAKVNTSCGLHVHIDMSEASLEAFKRICTRFIKFEPVFRKIVRKDRENNSYCRPNSECFESLEDAFSKINNAFSLQHLAYLVNPKDRYFMLNCRSFWKHGTIEFRLKEATLDPEEVINWLTMLLIWVEDSIQIKTRLGKSNSQFDSLCAMMAAPKSYNQLSEPHRRQVYQYIQRKVKQKV